MTDKIPSSKNTFKSVASAFLGVQSHINREKDFSEGKLSHFIIVAIISIIVFIALLVAIVTLVIPSH